MAIFRYLVADVSEAVHFYEDALGFSLRQQFGPAMAILEREDLQLWLAGPTSSAAKILADGSRPCPGGWNRLVLKVENLPDCVSRLQEKGITFRGGITSGPGGGQILCVDPCGNLVELFSTA